MLYTEKKAVKEGKPTDTVKIQNHTFVELAEKYKTPASSAQASGRVKGYIIDALVERFGSLPLNRFDTLLIKQLKTDLMAKGFKKKSVKGMKAGGYNKVLNVLKHMFKEAVEWEWVDAETL